MLSIWIYGLVNIASKRKEQFQVIKSYLFMNAIEIKTTKADSRSAEIVRSDEFRLRTNEGFDRRKIKQTYQKGIVNYKRQYTIKST